MTVLVLVGYLQAVAAGRLHPDDMVDVHSEFASADGRSRFHVDEASDDDRVPWTWTHDPLRRLAERMVTHSSNLATDLVIERVGFGAVVQVGDSVDGVHVRSATGHAGGPKNGWHDAGIVRPQESRRSSSAC